MRFVLVRLCASPGTQQLLGNTGLWCAHAGLLRQAGFPLLAFLMVSDPVYKDFGFFLRQWDFCAELPGTLRDRLHPCWL